MSLKCNICWEELHQDAFLVLSCSHIFCPLDAKKHFSIDQACPVCDTPVTSRSGLVHLLLTNSAEKTISLCGLTPKKILEIANKAIDFYNYQKSTEFQFLEQNLKTVKSECQQSESKLREQLAESQSKVKVLTHQFETLETERRQEKKEFLDLQQKYSENSRQKRKVEELYDTLRKKYDPGFPYSDSHRPRSEVPRSQGQYYPRQIFSPKLSQPVIHTPPPHSKTINIAKSPTGRFSSSNSNTHPNSPGDRFARIRRNSPNINNVESNNNQSISKASSERNTFTPSFFDLPNRPKTPDFSYLGLNTFPPEFPRGSSS